MPAINVDMLINLLKRQFPLFSEGCSWFYDRYYYAWSNDDVVAAWQEWHDYYTKELLKYIPEAFDCDDFAEQFKCVARRTLIKRHKMYIGSVAPAVAIGELHRDGEFLGYHAWNLILLHVGLDSYILVHFEPQTLDLWTGDISPDGFKYILRWVVW